MYRPQGMAWTPTVKYVIEKEECNTRMRHHILQTALETIKVRSSFIFFSHSAVIPRGSPRFNCYKTRNIWQVRIVRLSEILNMLSTTYFIELLFYFVFKFANIIHGHLTPIIQQTKNLTVGFKTKDLVIWDHFLNRLTPDKKLCLPVEEVKDSLLSVHNVVFNPPLKSEPFEFNCN